MNVSHYVLESDESYVKYQQSQNSNDVLISSFSLSCLSSMIVNMGCCDDFKITYQRRMVGECNLWYLKMSYVNSRAMKNIIELSTRQSAGVGGVSLIVGSFQTSGHSKQL